MLRLFHNPQTRRPTAAMAVALTIDGLPPGMEPSTLLVVQQHGTYSGRRVSYFRIFDPVRIAERGLHVCCFTDLDTYADLVLGSGHIEADGNVVLSKRSTQQVTATPIRSEANRAAHTDDERIVFPTPTG